MFFQENRFRFVICHKWPPVTSKSHFVKFTAHIFIQDTPAKLLQLQEIKGFFLVILQAHIHVHRQLSRGMCVSTDLAFPEGSGGDHYWPSRQGRALCLKQFMRSYGLYKHKWNCCEHTHDRRTEINGLENWELLYLISPLCRIYMRCWTGSILVQIMACRLVCTKPLSEPMLVYC